MLDNKAWEIRGKYVGNVLQSPMECVIFSISSPHVEDFSFGALPCRKTQGGRPVIPAKKKKLGFISKGPTFLGGHLVGRII